MNGVSYMIPFVVVGGLLIAISLSLGGHTDPSGGLVIPKDSFWMDVNNVGVIGFTLIVPILSGYIAYAIGDRPYRLRDRGPARPRPRHDRWLDRQHRFAVRLRGRRRVHRGDRDRVPCLMIAVPEVAAGDEHLRILAKLSRQLTDAGFRERLAAAEDVDSVLGVLGEIG